MRDNGFVEPLVQWYRENKRDLPWREDPPVFYHVWLSEIMLQQTRIAAVIPYYRRFLDTCATIEELASLTGEQVDKLWEGLGYYSRGRNLHKAACLLAGKEPPHTAAGLVKLPGIGPYTAAAIGSIVFGDPVPVVDGNVLRVCARLFCLEDDMRQPAAKKAVEQILKPMIPVSAPGDFNQGIMELGETVCTQGNTPRCDACPLASFCQSREAGTQGLYPVLSPKPQRSLQELDVFLLRTPDGKVILEQRPAGGLLANLFTFPMAQREKDPKIIRRALESRYGELLSFSPIGSGVHKFTHMEWHMNGYEAILAREPAGVSCYSWETVERDLSIPRAHAFILRHLAHHSR